MFTKVQSIISLYQNKLYLLAFLFLLVAFFDLIGISLLLKLMNLIMDYDPNNSFTLVIQDFFNTNDKSNVIIIYASFLIFFSMFKNLIKFMTLRFQFGIVKRLHTHISSILANSYLNANFEKFSKYNPQELVKNSIDSVNVFITFIIIGGLNLVSNLLIAFVLISFLFYKSFFMTMSVLIIIMGINYIFIKVSKKNSTTLQQERENIIAKMYDDIANIIYNKLEIFAYKKENYFNQTYSGQVSKFNENRYKFNIINSLPQIYSDFILYFSVSLIVIFLFVFSANTSNALELLILYALVMIRIVPVSSSIISSYNNIKYYSDSINIIYNILNIKKHQEYRKFDSNTESISVENLTLAYDKTKVLNNIDININKNSKVAFVGASGSGKSTLVKSIIGSIPPIEGHIKLYSNSIAYVTQEPYFFDGTILENILFGDKDVDHKKLDEVLQKCLLTEMISSFSNGVNTQIGHRASLLSGGQKQRLALARALYFDSDVVVLDEVTSALDNKSESEIRKVIDNMENTTVIMIAHRLSSIKNFDNIVLLQEKKIIAQGNYTELLNKSQDFKHLVTKGSES